MICSSQATKKDAWNGVLRVEADKALDLLLALPRLTTDPNQMAGAVQDGELGVRNESLRMMRVADRNGLVIFGVDDIRRTRYSEQRFIGHLLPQVELGTETERHLVRDPFQ